MEPSLQFKIHRITFVEVVQSKHQSVGAHITQKEKQVRQLCLQFRGLSTTMWLHRGVNLAFFPRKAAVSSLDCRSSGVDLRPPARDRNGRN